MNKLYFVETNGGYMTVATSADGRACYLWQDGQERDYPINNRWNDADDAERQQIAQTWLESVKEWNDFDSICSDCDTVGGYTGVFTAAEFAEDLKSGASSIIAEIDF